LTDAGSGGQKEDERSFLICGFAKGRSGMALEDLLDRFRSRMSQRLESRKLRRQNETALIQAIDQVVKTSAPVMCSLRDCRQGLRSPVQNALTYIQKTIDAIPGPAPLAPDGWDRYPLLKALFVDPEEIRALLAEDPRLRSFFTRQPASRAFALLTATKRERTIFGTAVEGTIVRRDVPQTAVEFHDHRIIDPSAAETETRRALMDRALNALVTQVLERLLELRALKDELKEQQRILSIQLKIQQTRMHGLDALASEEATGESAPPAAHPVLSDIDRQIQDLAAESDSPEVYLRQLTAVLNAPQQVLTVAPIGMRLNWMGVKQGDAAADGERDIRLAEVQFQDRLKRVAVFVDIDRQDCLKL
jgi:hypothetical protein